MFKYKLITMLQAKDMLNRNEQGHKEIENSISLHFKKTVHYRVYKCTVILHVPMGRAHRESSMSRLDYDAKRVAKILSISDQVPHPWSSWCKWCCTSNTI